MLGEWVVVIDFGSPFTISNICYRSIQLTLLILCKEGQGPHYGLSHQHLRNNSAIFYHHISPHNPHWTHILSFIYITEGWNDNTEQVAVKKKGMFHRQCSPMRVLASESRSGKAMDVGYIDHHEYVHPLKNFWCSVLYSRASCEKIVQQLIIMISKLGSQVPRLPLGKMKTVGSLGTRLETCFIWTTSHMCKL